MTGKLQNFPMPSMTKIKYALFLLKQNMSINRYICKMIFLNSFKNPQESVLASLIQKNGCFVDRWRYYKNLLLCCLKKNEMQSIALISYQNEETENLNTASERKPSFFLQFQVIHKNLSLIESVLHKD